MKTLFASDDNTIWRYDMLHPLDAQRHEFETREPVLWKHRLIPLQLADMRKRLRRMEKQNAHHPEGSINRSSERYLRSFIAAYEKRYNEGIAKGLPNVIKLENAA